MPLNFCDIDKEKKPNMDIDKWPNINIDSELGCPLNVTSTLKNVLNIYSKIQLQHVQHNTVQKIKKIMYNHQIKIKFKANIKAAPVQHYATQQINSKFMQ